MEPGVAGDHTPTLKSELGYLRLESLQALGNGDFEVEETLVFSGIFLFSCVWRLRRFKNMRGEQVCGVFTCWA